MSIDQRPPDANPQRPGYEYAAEKASNLWLDERRKNDMLESENQNLRIEINQLNRTIAHKDRIMYEARQLLESVDGIDDVQLLQDVINVVKKDLSP